MEESTNDAILNNSNCNEGAFFKDRDMELDFRCFDPQDYAFSKGLDILNNRGTVLYGISLANSYFTQNGCLASITKYFKNKASNFFPFTPSKPSIHTYNVKGYKCASKKVARDFKHLKRLIDKAIEEASGGICKFNSLSWESDIDEHPEYNKSLIAIRELYASNAEFRKDVRETSCLVIDKIVQPSQLESAIDEGKEFLLKELAFLVVSPQILGVESVAYVYHLEWPIFNKLINGKYQTEPVKNVGYLILCQTRHHL
jgi:tRNA-dependent cyclodipeptide synthase